MFETVRSMYKQESARMVSTAEKFTSKSKSIESAFQSSISCNRRALVNGTGISLQIPFGISLMASQSLSISSDTRTNDLDVPSTVREILINIDEYIVEMTEVLNELRIEADASERALQLIKDCAPPLGETARLIEYHKPHAMNGIRMQEFENAEAETEHKNAPSSEFKMESARKIQQRSADLIQSSQTSQDLYTRLRDQIRRLEAELSKRTQERHELEVERDRSAEDG